MKSKMAVATVSWARTEEEKHLILATMKELDKLGLPVILTDQSDSKFPLFDDAKKLKNFQVFMEDNLDSKVKNSLSKAAEIGEIVFYTESDKLNFVRDHAKSFIDKSLKNLSGISLAARLPKNFQKVPEYQMIMERFLADTFGFLSGKSFGGDFYGPRIIPSSLVKYLDQLDENIGFGWQAYLLAVAHRLNLPIKIFSFDVLSPDDVQKNKELVLFRMKQAIAELKGFEKGMEVAL